MTSKMWVIWHLSESMHPYLFVLQTTKEDQILFDNNSEFSVPKNTYPFMACRENFA